MSLYKKALACAIKDIKAAETREEANERYLKWESFHKNAEFKEAIQEKKIKFKQTRFKKL